MDNGFPHFMPYGVPFATSGANASINLSAFINHIDKCDCANTQLYKFLARANQPTIGH